MFVRLQPSQELRQYFSAAGPEVEGVVLQMLNVNAAAVFPSEMAPEPIAFLSSSMSMERRQEVTHFCLACLVPVTVQAAQAAKRNVFHRPDHPLLAEHDAGSLHYAIFIEYLMPRFQLQL